MQKNIITIFLISTFPFLSFYGFGQGGESLYNRILSIDSLVRSDSELQTNSFSPNESASLPIGIVKEIGQTKYIICIDSAYFTPQGAFFSVYMALDFPNSSKKVAFAAKNVQFNPKGVIVSEGARLKLISQQVISLGPKLDLIFKNNDKNYIEWDCNGYKQTGLSVDFVLKNDFFENAINPSLPVKASMETVIPDLNNILFTLNEMDPFKVKGAGDFIFSLENISIDQSDELNPSGLELPSHKVSTLVGGVESWKGFFAQNAMVTLPETLNSSSGETTIYANNLFIDDGGLSGTFGADNVFTLNDGGDASGWPFSVSSLSVSFENNEISAGTFSGSLGVRPLDDAEFEYCANVYQNSESENIDYSFIASPANNSSVEISAISSSLNIAPSSSISISKIGGRFKPELNLSGNLTLNHEKANINNISFQGVKVVTESPFITEGSFSLNSNNGGLAGVPIVINSIGMNLNHQNQLFFGADVGMNLGGDDNSTSFSVETAFQISTINKDNQRLEFDKLSINQIAFEINTSPFYLAGVIDIREDDPVFGDLFYGSISMQLNNIMDNPVMVSAGFGKVPNHRYWFVDAAAPVNIPIVSGFNIKSIYGGAQNKVSSTFSNSEMLDRVTGDINTSGNTLPFTPNSSSGLEFRAGVAFDNVKEDIFNSEALFVVAFNASGGFASIDFMGQAYMMVNRGSRSSQGASKVQGGFDISYNHNNKVFSSNLNASIVVPNILTGGLNINILVSEDDWYFWLNRPSNRAFINLMGVFDVNTYLMLGTVIDPIPPPPSYVTNLVGSGNLNDIDHDLVAQGDGFVTGMAFNAGFTGEFPKNTKWRGYVGAAFGGGFDVLLAKFGPNVTCQGSSESIGVNGFYAAGQVYLYLQGELGARKYKNGELKNEYQLGALQFAALLQGKLPNPTYIYGAVGVQASVLNIINFSFDVDFEFGNDCNIVY